MILTFVSVFTASTLFVAGVVKSGQPLGDSAGQGWLGGFSLIGKGKTKSCLLLPLSY